MGVRSIVIAHGEEDAFHIPLNVILRNDTRNSVFTRWMMLETSYMVRSLLKLLLHLPNRCAWQCDTPIQNLDICVDGENDVLDVKFETKTIILENIVDNILEFHKSKTSAFRGDCELTLSTALVLRRNPKMNLLTSSRLRTPTQRSAADGLLRSAAGREFRSIPRVPLAVYIQGAPS